MSHAHGARHGSLRFFLGPPDPGGLNAGTAKPGAFRTADSDIRRADVADAGHPSCRLPRLRRVPGVRSRHGVRRAGRQQVLRLLPDLGRDDGGPDPAGRQRRVRGARRQARRRLAVRHARREPELPEDGAAAGIPDAADRDRAAQPPEPAGVRLPAAAVLPAGLPGLPVSGDRAHPRPARGAAGLDHRGRGNARLRPPAGGQARPARRLGHARRERRRPDLAAVPEPGGRPAGPDLSGGGPARADRAPAAGGAAGSCLGRGRLLGGRVLRREHGPALPAPLRVRGRAQWLLRADGQPAGRVGPCGQPVRRQ